MTTNSKKWLAIIIAFIVVRVAIFSTFWQASIIRGGWQNFFAQAQPASAILLKIFHDYCDWHPPLYYALTSLVLSLAGSHAWIYIIQSLLFFASIIISYKIARLYFNNKFSLVLSGLLAIEPYWAWQNMLLASENLSTPLILLSLYLFLKYFQQPKIQLLAGSGLFLGLATLTRPNSLLLVGLLPVFLLVAYLRRELWQMTEFKQFSWRRIVLGCVVLVLAAMIVIGPWMVRNKFEYGRYTYANILSTNVYFYNLPMLMSYEDKIPYQIELAGLVKQAQIDLGSNVGDQGDCNLFNRQEFSRQLDYYDRQAKTYLSQHLIGYTFITIVRSAPFFIQPGYYEMWSAYDGIFNKPDFSGLIMSGSWREIISSLSRIDLKFGIFLLGSALWSLISLSIILALAYSYLFQRRRFVFFFFSFLVIVSNALITSPFAVARYRLPLYTLFFISFLYMIAVSLRATKKSPRQWRESLKKIPCLSIPAKLLQEYVREKKLNKLIVQTAAAPVLPFENVLPSQLALGHEPTIRCNLSCKMCYQRENRGHRREEVPAEKVLEFYDKLGVLIEEVKLVGGEPLVYPGIFILMNYWNRRAVPIILQTNCTLINESNIKELAKYDKLKAVLTSLDGPQEIHDDIRGVPGSFQKLRSAVYLINQELPNVEVSAFATLLLDDNLDSLFGLIREAKGIGLTGINILFEQFYSPAEAEATKKILQSKFGWQESVDYRLNTQLRNVAFKKPINAKKLKWKLLLVRIYGLLQGVPVNLTPFNYYSNLEGYLGIKSVRAFCHKLLSQELRVSQEGDVIWCDIIEKSFGNLTDLSPEEIWLSKDFQDFRRFLQKNTLPICYRCCKASYLKK